MAKKKVEVLGAVVDGHVQGDVIEIDAKSAEALVKNGYVKYVDAKKQDDKKSDDK